LAWVNYDNDSDYDLLIANTCSNENDFFINEKGSCTNRNIVKLQGCNSNSNGIGTMIKVKSLIGGDYEWQTKDVSTQIAALGGQNSSKILFGLLDATSVDSLIIEWLSGIVTTLVNPTINQLLTVNEEFGSKVCGVIYHDTNANGVQGSIEIGIPNMELMLTPGNCQILTDENGIINFTYKMRLILYNKY
jgi:hypothetical protein